MKACIQYDSKTGNTKQLADVIRKTFSQNLVDTPEQADVIFLGSWTDKGSCSQAIQAVAENLQNKKVFLFGTCGFGGSEAYYDQIFRRTAALLPASNQIIGHFYCQGKMPVSVKERYLKMLQEDPGNSRLQQSLENFEHARTHPDQQYLRQLQDILNALVLP